MCNFAIVNIRFISLRLVKHNDSQSILTAYSRELGRVSLSVTASPGRAGNRVRALVMPMNEVECTVEPRPGREVWGMRGPQALNVMPGVHSSPQKQMIAIFLAETLTAVLGESEGNEALYDFITASMRRLDQADDHQTANFHLCFLAMLTRLLGIAPDMESYRDGRVLDMRGGVWLATPPFHPDYLAGEEAVAARRALQMTFDNSGAYRYSREERGRLLDGILTYYSIHYVPLKGLKSLEVLRSLT